MPLKAGRQRKSASRKFHEKQMMRWLAGEHEECWQTAITIEHRRQTRIKRRNLQRQKGFINREDNRENDPQLLGEQLTKEQKQRYRRARNYVNVGELGKGMTAIRSNGIAPVDENVLTQLRSKHPLRQKAVALPPLDEFKTEYADIDQKIGHISQEYSQHVAKILDSILPSVTVTAENILSAAKSARRLTSGGLQQITPWHLKRALLADTNQAGAIAASRLATRWARGDFSSSLGELVAEAQLIALYKDSTKTDVRPVGVGCALRRLLTKAYCAKTRAQILAHVDRSQLGVLKGGYEIGVHAMRELAKQANLSAEVIMLLDFLNAFNTVDRNLMLKLACAHCPELAKLTLWLYQREPLLVTTRGDTLKSSTGTKQGCTLSNPLFALTMEFIASKIQNIEGVRVKQFFWDDTALIGSPKAVSIAARTIQDLSHVTSLQLNWKKCHLHGSPEVIK